MTVARLLPSQIMQKKLTALRAILWAFAIMLGLGGVAFALTPTVAWLSFGLPGSALTAWSTWLLRDLGGIAIGLAWLTILVAREPVRYAGILRALAVMLAALTLTGSMSILGSDAAAYHPFENPLWLWSKVLFRGLMAASLWWLTPHEVEPRRR